MGKVLKKKKVDKILDCLGLFCPEPVYRTRLELDKMKLGETLEIWADDQAAERDMRSLTKRLGHKILEIKKEGDKLHILIKKLK
jgi:TusA-related sulfurtransferase